jgi:uncharacterized protein YdaU (DUF1376 family)
MAALPYMPLFVADYLADTRHLTAAQHGAYLLLIFNYWQTGKPLPNDDVKLARIASMSRRDWAHNRAAILEFFTVQENLLVHARIAQELSRVEAKSLKSKKAAQASVERRFGERSADVEPTDTDTDTDKEKKKIMPAKAGDYAFFGQTIKLAPRHLAEWRRIFHSIPDIEAELSTLDDWWQAQPVEKRGNWFLATKGMLNKRHQENLTARRDYDPDRITV